LDGGRTIVARTKFSIPHVPNATIHRQALVARLDAAADRPLSLVVAAPGSGKTALLTQWVEGVAGPVAWMSCDATDADVSSFWTNLATAIRSAWTDTGARAPEVAGDADHDQLAIGIANELGALDRHGAIVIDDFHLAGAEPAAMKSFVDALPPGVRLVVGSRCDPPFSVSRMRLQGRLLELRQADLRFSTAEVRELLTRWDVEVGDRELEQITVTTEGWTAAVHLAGLWLRAHHDPPGLLRGLLGSDRSLVDFLVNEVIDTQPPEIVEFLTVTAELGAFDAALCDAVLNRDDSTETLRRVDIANLFLVRLDGTGDWYRYHHLFAQFLRGRLHAAERGRAAVVHRAAAEEYERRGDLMSAVHHSLEASDADGALALLQSYVTTNWSLEDQMTGGAAARAWLRERGPAHLDRSPQSVIVSTILLNAIGHGDEATPWLRHLDAREPDLDRETRFLLHGAWAFHLFQHGDPAAALDRAERAEAVLREHPVHNAWAEALPNVVIQGRMWLDDLDGADAAIDAMRDAAHPPVVSQVRVPGLASQVQALRGELREAHRLASSALAVADELGLHGGNFGRADPHLTLALVAAERDHLEEAGAHLEHAMRAVEGGRRPLVEVLVHLQLALGAGARGDERAAMAAVEQARSLLPQAAVPVTARIDEVELRVALDRGDHRAAEALQQRLPPSARGALLTARVRLAAGDHGGALDVLDAMAGQCSTRRLEVEHGMLSALAAAGTEHSRAHELLYRALARAEPVGFHTTFVAEGPPLWNLLESLPAHGRIADYIAQLLEAAQHVVAPSRDGAHDGRAGLVEPLSERELTVLRYLSSRLTSAEIAQELYVSVNTVRSHIKAIYRKLGVNSRRDAVERGQALRADIRSSRRTGTGRETSRPR
jgi:LuxR family maltose regulon positive regulatory protein